MCHWKEHSGGVWGFPEHSVGVDEWTPGVLGMLVNTLEFQYQNLLEVLPIFRSHVLLGDKGCQETLPLYLLSPAQLLAPLP